MKLAFRNFAAFGIFMKVSVKNIILLSGCLLVMSACGKKEKELSPAEINAKADSILRTRLDKLRREAKEDLDRRLPIEIKPKVDSIRNVNNITDAVPVFPDDGSRDTSEPDIVPLPGATDTAKK